MKELAPEFGMALVCRVLGVARSTGNYKSVAKPKPDLSLLKTEIETFRLTHRQYGVRKMRKLFERDGTAPSFSRMRTAYIELNILRKPGKKRIYTTDSTHAEPRFENLLKGLKVTHPDHIWVCDVTGVYLKKRWVYVALVMDIYTRAIVGWNVAESNVTDLTLGALRKGFDLERSPEIHHSDQGANYCASRYCKILQARGIQISMSATGKPRENAHAERLNRTLKYEGLKRAGHLTLYEVETEIQEFVEYYNNTRIHASIGFKTPSEILVEWNQPKRI